MTTQNYTKSKGTKKVAKRNGEIKKIEDKEVEVLDEAGEVYAWSGLKEPQKSFYRILIRKAFGNISFACEIAKVGRKTVYLWKDKDEQFAKLMEKSIIDALANDEVEKHFIVSDLLDPGTQGAQARRFRLLSKHPEYKRHSGLFGGDNYGPIQVVYKSNVPRPERIRK